MHTRFPSALHAHVNPAPALAMTTQQYNPKIHHVSQEDALEAACELEQKRFNQMGSIEQYSGIHPKYGRCIIIITASSDSTIIPMT